MIPMVNLNRQNLIFKYEIDRTVHELLFPPMFSELTEDEINQICHVINHAF